jgi:hypothetical protein
METMVHFVNGLKVCIYIQSIGIGMSANDGCRYNENIINYLEEWGPVEGSMSGEKPYFNEQSRECQVHQCLLQIKCITERGGRMSRVQQARLLQQMCRNLLHHFIIEILFLFEDH